MITLAWGNKVSIDFREKLTDVCDRLLITDPSWLMACMAFETARTFSPTIRNAAGSGAIGLIQFMPSTAAALGTSTEDLAKMTDVQQLTFVERYFRPWRGSLKSLGDVYGAILWPGMIGKPNDAIVFEKGDPNHPKLYLQNRGLDLNHDDNITKSEIVSRVQRELDDGMLPEHTSPLLA